MQQLSFMIDNMTKDVSLVLHTALILKGHKPLLFWMFYLPKGYLRLFSTFYALQVQAAMKNWDTL